MARRYCSQYPETTWTFCRGSWQAVNANAHKTKIYGIAYLDRIVFKLKLLRVHQLRGRPHKTFLIPFVAKYNPNLIDHGPVEHPEHPNPTPFVDYDPFGSRPSPLNWWPSPKGVCRDPGPVAQ